MIITVKPCNPPLNNQIDSHFREFVVIISPLYHHFCWGPVTIKLPTAPGGTSVTVHRPGAWRHLHDQSAGGF